MTDIQQHVFLGKTGKRVINIQHSFDGAVTRAGLKDVHFHDLRRSFVTRKVTEGWDRDHVKAITGHRTDKVFASYNKPSLETLWAVVEGTFNSACVPWTWTRFRYRAKCPERLYGGGWGPMAPPVFKSQHR